MATGIATWYCFACGRWDVGVFVGSALIAEIHILVERAMKSGRYQISTVQKTVLVIAQIWGLYLLSFLMREDL